MNAITLQLNPQLKEPLYEQIYQFIKSEITSGRFPYNTKLPSKRQLSAYLQCSQNTVQAAYDQLTAEGYTVSKPRSGYYVCRLDGIVSLKKETTVSLIQTDSKLKYQYEFSHHGVDLDSFPFYTWRRITKNVINEYDISLLKISDAQGDVNLRSGIADYLHHSRGVNCSPEQIIVSSGTEFLFLFLIQIFDRDKVFAIENPGYEKLNLIFKSLTGTTIMSYLISFRIGKAKRLLQFTESDVTDIALGTGFYDSQHFGKTFKNRVGCTPTQFRENTE